jgi:hypothetical protein
MRGLAQFVRKCGWQQVAMLLLGVATILLSNDLGSSPYIVVPLRLVGALLILLVLICLVIGPPDESPEGESPEGEDVAQVGLEVPPETPVRLPEGVPRGTKVQITASEELEKDDERSGDAEPPDPKVRATRVVPRPLA